MPPQPHARGDLASLPMSRVPPGCPGPRCSTLPCVFRVLLHVHASVSDGQEVEFR